MTTYVALNPCSKGHEPVRYTKSRECVACRRDYNITKRTNHRDTLLKAQLRWKSENKEHLKAYMAQYLINNKEQRYANNRNYRAKKRNAEGRHDNTDIQVILLQQNYFCNGCGCHLDEYDVDHIIPLSRGGSNWPSNLQCLCPTCNGSKNDKTMIEWLEWLTEIKNKLVA